jgi:hypothetical protein
MERKRQLLEHEAEIFSRVREVDQYPSTKGLHVKSRQLSMRIFFMKINLYGHVRQAKTSEGMYAGSGR